MPKQQAPNEPPRPTVATQLIARFPDGVSPADVEKFDANTTASLLNALIASWYRADAEVQRAKARSMLIAVVLAAVAVGVAVGVIVCSVWFNPIRDLVQALNKP